jgi:hypothetical protein
MIQARHAVAISCGALLVAALAATSHYIGSQEKKTQQATIQSGVVLLPGETLVAAPDPVASGPVPQASTQGTQPSTPHYTRDEVLRRR